jgi:hypothetical protein
VESENLSVDLEKNGHFVMKVGYLHTKIIVFGENSADRKLRYMYSRLRERKGSHRRKTVFCRPSHTGKS